jgi:hypothetical protein
MRDEEASQEASEEAAGAQAQEWTEPVRLRYVGRDPDVLPIRHVWCMGPCFTHALELGARPPAPAPPHAGALRRAPRAAP